MAVSYTHLFINVPVSTWDIGLEQLTILVTYPTIMVAKISAPSLWMCLVNTDRMLFNTPSLFNIPPMPTANVIIATY